MIGLGISDVEREQAVGFHAALHVLKGGLLVDAPIGGSAVVQGPVSPAAFETARRCELQQAVVVIADIHGEGEAQLALVAEAIGLGGFELGARESGKEHGRQNRNNGDDYQEFNECECVRSA